MKPGDRDYPSPTSRHVSTVMRANRKRDTRPEVQIRSLLHRMGYRFRNQRLIEAHGLKVRPDIVFPGPRLVVFVDGCFWHCCPEHGNVPRANTHYWRPKLRRNVERDRQVTAALQEAGWRVLRIWEHVPPAEAAAAIAEALAGGAG